MNAHQNKITGLKTVMEKLAQVRDEQRVKLHLAQADARNEWERLEKKWSQLRNRAHQLEEVAEEVGDDLWEGVEHLVDDLHHGYDKLRRAL